MKIAFDYQIFFLQEYGGISRYYSYLAEYLNATQDTEARIFAGLHINDYLSSLPAGIVKGYDVRNRHRSKKLFRMINNIMSGYQMKHFKPDVVHKTYFFGNTPAPKGTPCVVTVYDMIHERFSDLFPRNDQTSHMKEEAVKNADHVICISKSTQRDLIRFFNTPEQKTSVIYLGFKEFDLGENNMNLPLAPAEKPYFLYVGQRSAYKNFSNFIQAFAASPELKRDFNVVCFGGGEFHAAETNIFMKLGLNDSQVMHIGGGDGNLSNCYKNAFAFVYPSLYEGFGIPPLEAMSLDCPVICSNTSSIPEVVAESAEYFDPADIDSIRKSLERIAGSADRRDELVRQGKARLLEFTWEKCARETRTIYGNIT